MHMRRYIPIPLHHYQSLNKGIYNEFAVFTVINSIFDISLISVTLYLGQNCLFLFVLFGLHICSMNECDFCFQMCFILY